MRHIIWWFISFLLWLATLLVKLAGKIADSEVTICKGGHGFWYVGFGYSKWQRWPNRVFKK